MVGGQWSRKVPQASLTTSAGFPAHHVRGATKGLRGGYESESGRRTPLRMPIAQTITPAVQVRAA